MYIGSITDKCSPVSAKYTYRKRGLYSPLFPDLHPEQRGQEGFMDFRSGNLGAGRKTGWKWPTVLDTGIDIVIELSCECFIDQVVIRQGKESGPAAVGILYEGAGGFPVYAGRVNAGPDGVIQDAEIRAAAGVLTDKLIVRLDGFFRDIVIESVDVIGALIDEPVVYPIPSSMAVEEDISMRLCDLRRIIVPEEVSEDIIFAARLLRDKIEESLGVKISVSGANEVESFKDCVVFSSRPGADGAASGPDPGSGEEGYHLKALKNQMHLSSSGRRGLIYGAETVLTLLKNGAVPVCEINDYPYLEIRGVHIGLPPRGEIPFIKRLIKYLLAPMRFNTMFLEIAGGMRFDSHPEINESWLECNLKAKQGKLPPFPHGSMVAGGEVLEKDEVAELAGYARSYGVEVIPEVQSLSHVQYITAAHPDIGEREETAPESADINLEREDTPPDEFYAHCYCASNKKSWGIVFDLIDEIVETVKPSRYVHMGHDEVYHIGICPACRTKDPSDLLAEHINRMDSHLKKQNLTMMIWADMLQDATKYKTPCAISKISRDIVLLDFIWYFNLDRDIEDRLLEHGFSVIMGNMYSSHYPRYESRAGKKGIIGAQVSTWCRADEHTLGVRGKIFDLLYSSNMMWSDGYRSDARLVYNRIISNLMPELRSHLHHEKYPSLLEPKKCIPIELPVPGGDSSVPCELLEAIPPLVAFAGNVPLTVKNPQCVRAAGEKGAGSTPVEIFAEGCYDSLLFLHSAGGNVELLPSKPPIKIGEYIIEYEDSHRVSIPVEYGVNIAVWSRRHALPMTHAYYRHQGYFATYHADACVQTCTGDGRDVAVYGFEWINPRKNSKITSISLKAGTRADAPVFLFAITGIRLE